MTDASEVNFKRKPKCSGCSTFFEEHQWGTPGPHCTGEESSTSQNIKTDDAGPEQDEEEELAAQLEALELEEQQLGKRARITQLQEAISIK